MHTIIYKQYYVRRSAVRTYSAARKRREEGCCAGRYSRLYYVVRKRHLLYSTTKTCRVVPKQYNNKHSLRIALK